jgi:hypothetical protein
MKTTLFVDKHRKRTLTISTPVYESIKNFILHTIKQTNEVTFTYLLEQAAQNKTLQFEGNMSWCFLTVKRDLEARGIIKVSIGLGPRRIQTISMNKKGTR